MAAWSSGARSAGCTGSMWGEDMAIDVTCEVKNYDNPAKSKLRVHSHWNDSNMVEVEVVATGERYTVLGTDLITAIQDALNTNRFG